MTQTAPPKKNRRRLLRITLIVLGLLILLPILAILFLSEPLPQAQSGPEADSLARRMMQATGYEGWQQTAAISWNFMGVHQHLWDKERHYARVKWDDKEVRLQLDSQQGLAFQNGQQLEGEAAQKLVQQAWSFHCNDAFWLNPIAKLFDPGTSRGLVALDDGRQGLLITYTSGGVTPGDSYLWIPGENGLPEKWKMWVSIIPIGGVGTSWEGWITLPTGALISTRHKGPFGLELTLTDLQADTSLLALTGGQDPFAELE